MLIIVALYVVYSLSRSLIRDDVGTAVDHALALVHVEELLGLNFEATIAQWLAGSTVLSVAASYAYATLHYTVTPLVLFLLHRRRPEEYFTARRVLVVATAVALVCYWLYPVAPPRLLSADYPDVLALTSHWGWWGAQASAPRGLGSMTNQYAALPSMHVGWAVWCAHSIWRMTGNRWLRGLAVAYPVLMTFVVVATSNHYFLDVVAGALVIGLVTLVLPAAEHSVTVDLTALDRDDQDDHETAEAELSRSRAA